jgi:hypothetical protein
MHNDGYHPWCVANGIPMPYNEHTTRDEARLAGVSTSTVSAGINESVLRTELTLTEAGTLYPLASIQRSSSGITEENPLT